MYLCNQNSIPNKIAYERTDPFHRRDTPLAHNHLPRSLRCDEYLVPRAPGASPAWQIILRINRILTDKSTSMMEQNRLSHSARTAILLAILAVLAACAPSPW